MEVKVNILNLETDKKISLLVYDKDNKLLRRIYLTGKNEYRNGIEKEVVFDLSKDHLIKFSYKKLISLPIYLSNSIPDIKVRINKRYNNFSVDFYNHGIKKTGHVYSKIFKSPLLKHKKNRVNTFIYVQNNPLRKKYRLIVAFDGQNMFSINGTGVYTKKHDPFGSWQLDQVLTKMNKNNQNPYIVLSIDNSDKYRDNDLTMSTAFGQVDSKFKGHRKFFNGKLELLSEVIVNDMFSYLKDNYDIDWESVGTLGASSGGLASFYLGLNYSHMFKYILAFSPALFFFKPDDLNKLVINKKELPHLVISGGHLSWLEKALTDYCRYYYPIVKDIYLKDKLMLFIDELYDHNEITWRYMLPKSLDFCK